MIKQASREKNRNSRAAQLGLVNIITISILLVIFIVGLFAPWISYGASIIFLIYTCKKSKKLIPLNLLLVSNAGSIIQASREFYGESSDFVNYYHVFQLVCGIDSVKQFTDGFGFEVGLSIVYGLIGVFGGCEIPIFGLAYVQSLVTCFTTMYIINIYVSKNIPNKYAGIVMMGFAGTISFYYSTQLGRQFVASACIFYVLFISDSKIKGGVGLLLASFFHSTSLIIFPVLYFLKYNQGLRSWPIVLIFMMLSVIAYSNINLISNLFSETFLSNKISYYETNEFGQSIYPDILTVITLCLVSCFWYFKPKNNKILERTLFYPVIPLSLIGIILLPFPLMATRFLFLYGSLLSGMLIFYMLSTINKSITLIILISIVIIKSISYSGIFGSDNGLWVNYPPYNSNPGYFFSYK